uniref:Uncharacterized protein n=1 Tax=Arundo donax TaxID=35708 RepID=A0A0A9ERE5_ARUDO
MPDAKQITCQLEKASIAIMPSYTKQTCRLLISKEKEDNI